MYSIPVEMPKFDNHTAGSEEVWEARNHYIEEGMYAFISQRWTKPLARWIGQRKCLEIMSGRGILAYALQEEGVDLIATDNFLWAKKIKTYKKWIDSVTDVFDIDAIAAIEKYGADIDLMIMSWPAIDNLAYKAIKRLYEINPRAKVIYIGEQVGGRTAFYNFFEHFQMIYDEQFAACATLFEAWPGFSDQLVLGKYEP